MPGKSQIGGVNLAGLLYIGVVLLVMFLPLLLGRRGSPPGRPDSDSDDGWGKGPRRPQMPPDLPRGGIPMPDAEPARERLRDHHRLRDRIPAPARRPAREPDRRPERLPGPL
jgi:hypothetical protein